MKRRTVLVRTTRRATKRLTLLATFCMTLTAVPLTAHAQLLLDQTMSGLGGGATELGSTTVHANKDAIAQRLQRMGYHDFVTSPTNPNQLTATNSEGMRIKLSLDPTTGNIVGAVPE